MCLPLCTASVQEAHVCFSQNKNSQVIHASLDINKDNMMDNIHSEPTNPPSEAVDGLNFCKSASSPSFTNMSCIVEDCLRYTHAKSLKSQSSRTQGTHVFGTLINTSINVQHFNVRLYHNRSSSKDCGVKLGAEQSDHNRSDLDVKAQLTHTDAQGQASMVDVGGKIPTRRTATASATVILGPTAFWLLRDNQLAKGDALVVAQLSGIMASKQTSALIPLCHPLPLDHTSIAFDLDELQKAVIITAACCTTGRTGVEMEALTAVSVAALTVYDMCKAVSHDIIITDINLVSKTGGKKDFRRHPMPSPSTINSDEGSSE